MTSLEVYPAVAKGYGGQAHSTGSWRTDRNILKGKIMIKKITLLILASSSISFAADPFLVISRANRKLNARTRRVTTTQNRTEETLTPQPNNGDEVLYADKRGSYGKALPQTGSGLVNPAAFNAMVAAINNGSSDAFLTIPMGTPGQNRLTDPQAGFAYNADGADTWIHSIPPAPTLTSQESADEMVEVYWMALCRDVFFNDYATNPTAITAASELSTLGAFYGPHQNGLVTAQTLFRGIIPGCLVGPYISQLLYQAVPNGPTANFSDGITGTPGIDFQASKVALPGINFITDLTTWFNIEKGQFPTDALAFTSTRVFLRNGRDLACYVHQDPPPMPYLNAGFIMLNYGDAALDPNNPYLNNPTQKSFVTYNNPDLCYLLSIGSESALRTAWYQKWRVHRRLRPEVYGFLAHQQKTGAANYGINGDLINSTALTQIFGLYGTYLLPQAFPEGSPTHPAYPAGHATVAGCCATILKAFFNENFVIPNPVEPNAANTALQAYTGAPLTLGNEINKLAANIAIGRNIAGVHYLSDATQSLLLGEKIALALLEDEAYQRNISFVGFTVTKFDGTVITVGAKQTAPSL